MDTHKAAIKVGGRRVATTRRDPIDRPPQHVAMTVWDYIHNFKNHQYGMPTWQRGQQPIWTKEYRDKLIESILMGIFINTIVIGKIIDGGKVIIDGGHRTRALRDFMNNEYFVTIGDEKVFYSEIQNQSGVRGRRVMTEGERSIIQDFRLTIVSYDKITEKQARFIFNRLQNAAPIAMPDIVNSWESPLVDYIRTLKDKVINGSTLYQHFENIKGLPKPDNNEFLYHCLSWFTIINPPPGSSECSGGNSDSVNAMKFLEKGKTRNSMCFKFLQEFETYSDEVTDTMKIRFNDAIENLISYLIHNSTSTKFLIPNGDQATFIHSYLWVQNFSKDEFGVFINKVDEYKTLDSDSKKLFKKGQRALADSKATQMEQLDTDNGMNISKWIKSRAANPTGYDSMKVRMELVKEYCCVMPSSDSDEDSIDEDFIPNVGVTIPTVTGLD
jgi:hypothetical protein